MSLFLVSTMREKSISGMMAAVHRRDTDVEEREKRISHLKKVTRLACVCADVLCNGVDRSLSGIQERRSRKVS